MKAKKYFSNNFESNPTSKEVLELLITKGYAINKSGKVTKNSRNVKLVKGSTGYFQISLTVKINGKKKVRTVRIHRFQAYKKFGGVIFEKGIQVRHLNGNKLDNSWNNLAIGNQSANRLDIPRKKRSKTLAKLGIEKIKQIKQDYINKAGGYKKLGDKYNVHAMTVRNIVKNRLHWLKESDI